MVGSTSFALSESSSIDDGRASRAWYDLVRALASVRIPFAGKVLGSTAQWATFKDVWTLDEVEHASVAERTAVQRNDLTESSCLDPTSPSQLHPDA